MAEGPLGILGWQALFMTVFCGCMATFKRAMMG